VADDGVHGYARRLPRLHIASDGLNRPAHAEAEEIPVRNAHHGVVISETTPARRWTALHVLLSVQSLLIVLVSVNRLSSAALGYVAANQFLRWVDLNNMILALISLVAFYLLKKHLEEPSPAYHGPAHRALGVVFIVGAYLLAASYGNHEVTNYLHARFCPADTASRLCDIIIYNDDGFSHLIFFAGFTLINLVIMLTQVVFPDRAPLTVAGTALVVVNALFIGAGIFANLAFEEIGLDLYVVAIIASMSRSSWKLRWRSPT
jgi:hypothetical protein